MRAFTVAHFLLFALMVLVCQCVHAQDYVLSLKGDTIKGSLKPVSFGFEKKVQVTTSDKKKTIYSIFQVREFSMRGDVYQPVRTQKGYDFMKVIKPGYLTLYAYQLENQMAYDGMYLMKRDGSGIEVPNLNFKKIISRYLEDCPTVSQKVTNGELGKRELTEIVTQYNLCIESKTLASQQMSSTPQPAVPEKSTLAWDNLESQVNAKADLEGKADILEMIGEIKTKVKKGDKVPNFMIEALKSTLSKTDLNGALNEALASLDK